MELGQGILTALAQIVADELDVTLDQVRMVSASTAHSPDEAVTSGSLSIQESGLALRHACAEARAIYLREAAAHLGVAAAALSVEGGRITGPSGSMDYWTLANDLLLDREATGAIATKPAANMRVIGQSIPRSDLPDKVFGVPRFIHDLTLPGMLHGRMLRPPSPTAVLVAVDTTEVEALRDVRVVRDGSFIGVIAETERAAAHALDALAKATQWRESAALPDQNALGPWLKAQRAETTIVATKTAPRPPHVARTVRAAYTKPFLAHASIGPSCAVAQWSDGGLEVWSHSQGIFNLRRDLGLALHLPADVIAVRHVEGAGCYGHNAADDVAFDAARLARAADGHPVRVQWSRADELGWSPFGPAMRVELEADLDAADAIVGWRHETWSNGHSTRPGRAKLPGLLGSWHLETPFERLIAINAPLAAGGGGERNSVPCYDLPAWEVINHRVLEMPLRTSALRALGAFANVFAIESFVDELATLVKADPVHFRLRHLRDERARTVVERVAANARWTDWKRREGMGHGIGFARYKHTSAYCAVIAEVEAEAAIRVRRLYIAVDVGQVINPDGVINQIEGGAIQAASWTIKEALRFDTRHVTSADWETYPIFRFADVPEVEVDIISRPEMPSMGAGEASLGPTAGAIANAVCDALGLRIRDLPLTPERIMAAME